MPDHIGLRSCAWNIRPPPYLLDHKSQIRERPMTRLKTESLGILGTAAIVVSVLASPAMAEGTVAKGAKYTQAQTKGSQTLAKGQRHVQPHATYRSQRMHNANAALPGGRVYRRPAGPG